MHEGRSAVSRLIALRPGNYNQGLGSWVKVVVGTS